LDANDLKKRTKEFALRVIKLTEALPNSRTADVIGKQLLRCGTSVGANYRAACRGRSKADFISKTDIVIEEADETIYWMELLIDSGIMADNRLIELKQEANELVANLTASSKTAQQNIAKKRLSQ
jgi:four helix bundle protein